jgi:hypothetical protein
VKRAAAAVVLALATAGAVAAAAIETAQFRYQRGLTAHGAVEPVAFEPDGPMLLHARPGFGDLRILDAYGVQVPWRRLPELQEVERDVELLNSGRAGNEAVALLDLGPGPAPYDRIELDIAKATFVGRARVLGSDRRAGPFRLLSTTGIYSIQGAQDARSTTAVVPRSDFRFLEVAASNVTRIDGARVSGSQERPRLTRRRHAILGGAESDSAETQFTLDFGTRAVPVTELAVSSTTPTYERPLRVEGSNDRESFQPLADARIFRFRGSSSAPVSFDSRFRYLRVTIENGDDSPLQGVRLETRGPSQAVLLEPGHEPPFRLLYGGPEVDAPSYEFARIPPPAPRTLLDPSELGPEQVNEAFEPPPDTRPFTERHPALIQLALALAAAALVAGGFFALRKRT